ncbi:hypothetical protein Ddye_023879 [Dipteronia dyeriana]|uniref:UBN2 domain-containing protein n=1 Tax=Dipteronia dyeriana TaxID=168575 RepID=A0AAD9TTU8_9ROSI|nr:hypothetical protein Ddye_023879 [Dipteronia dyeriana]
MDQLLMGWLLGSMTEQALVEVIGCNTPHDLWTALNQSKSRMQDLKESLSKTTKDSRSSPEYLALMKSFSDGLAAAGYPISNSELILVSLGGLQKEYESVIVNITSRVVTRPWLDERLIARFNPYVVLELGQPSANMATRKSGNSNNRNYNNSYQNQNQGRGRGNNNYRSG